MRFLSYMVSVGVLFCMVWFVAETKPEWKKKSLEILKSGFFHTLEVRYSAEQILDRAQMELNKDDSYLFLEPQLKFAPYILMEVKYSRADEATGEGVILWDLIDGEMVIDGQSWDKTHGFADCITSKATRDEFKILSLLANEGGYLDREEILQGLHVDEFVLESWLDSCRKKKLIVQSGNGYRIHLENPRLNIAPYTQFDTPLVTQGYKYAERLTRRFSPVHIKEVAESVFGNDFVIRDLVDVYLPIYVISLQNPDGSLSTSRWNALTGSPLEHSTFLE